MDVSLYVAAPGSRFWAASTPLSPAEVIARAADLGYDAVEIMPRDAGDPDPDVLRAAAARYGLTITAVASGFVAIERGWTFTHPDEDVRRRAVEAVRACIADARRAGASFVSIGPVRGKLHPGMDPADALEHLTACLRACGLTAGEMGITLTVEPGNRYETDFIHTVDEAAALLEALGLPSVRLQADTFHMNIEEVSLADAIRRAAPYLVHVHLADSNRRAPGWGHLDFEAVNAALREIAYRGGIGLEILFEPDFESAARQGIRFVRDRFDGRTP
ncbi:MAG: sugar phosphate isomerase/epimerase family protein [Armatimonadota bacterium]|nr:sugar phosphate isomerase/epimerase family protein [Armatimonadota bacterium]